MGNIPPSVLRQPPPPPRHHRSDGSPMAGVMDPHLNILPTLMTNKEEGKTEMVGGNCVSVNRITRPYYFRRCKRKRLTNIESLSDDLVFKILLHLPAQDIYDRARLVSRKWYHMIHTHNFIYAHLQHTTCGLLFQYQIAPQRSIFMAMRQDRIEISKFSYRFRCAVWASCNGLILEYEARNAYALYIANPATKQHFILPPFFCRILNKDLAGIAYAAASMEYKVVLTYAFEDKTEVEHCAILTVGVDNSWRHVRTEHLSFTAKEVFDRRPLITEGFMHWAINGTYGTQVLTLNVETEIITETPAPLPQVYREKTKKYYMSTGRYLSLLIACGKFFWEVWEMKPETGEWTKLPNIDLEAQKCTFERFGCKHDDTLIPVGWLKYLEVLVFGIAQACIFYNLHTHETDSTEFPTCSEYYTLLVHRNSPVWLGGC